MFDSYSYFSGEVRQLAFRKTAEHATWQEAIKQQQTADIENRWGKVFKNNLLVDLSRALLRPFIHSKRNAHESYADRVQAQQQPASLAVNLPSQPKAG
jgi:hypothetical protein